MPLNPNDTLLNGQYRVLRLLGRGGFGFVYQARDTLIHREVAIKELIPALVGDEATLKRFLVEARATLELAHESIVRTYNVFQEGGNYYIVMECMAGGSLEDRLREKGALPIDEAVRIAAQVCAGLDHAHRRGIVHCDLKPANILFTSDGTAKVADFGIAHVSGESLTRSWMTPAGFVAGTLPYMSPEQTDGLRDDPRVDLYAVGAVLYRMLTGKTYLDFDQRETPRAQAENVHRICEARPDPPSAQNRRIPAWLDAVVLKALSKRPEERYASAAEMQAVLERRGEALPVPPRVEAVLTPPRQSPAQRPRPVQLPAWFWPAAAAAGVLLIVLTFALGLLFGGGTDSPEPTQVAGMTPTATLAPTRTSPRPTNTPTPSNTPTPTASQTHASLPTFTPTPTNTATLPPTRIPLPPTWTPSPSPTPADRVQVTLTGQAALDGFRANNGGGNNAVDIRVGNGAMLESPSQEIVIRGFLSFDLSGIPATADIKSIELRFYQVNVTGTPYAKQDRLLIQHVDYGGALDNAAYDTPLLHSAILAQHTGPGEWYTITASTVADWIVSDLATGRTRFQVRLQFSPETDGDGLQDTISFESGENYFGTGNVPRLAIIYAP